MRVLIVSPYPPDRCGIASYTVQVAATLRKHGDQVDVISPQPSAARYWADYSHTARGLLRALVLSRRADRTIVQFFPDLLFQISRRHQFIRQWLAAVLLLGLGRRVELVVHEAPYRSLIGRTDLRGRLGRVVWRLLLAVPRRTYVHTEWERQQVVQGTGVRDDRITLLGHGQSFVRRANADRELARRELGLGPGFHFLSIGFLQPHKGFDRALRAMARLDADDVQLHIVGSIRVHSPEVLAHVEVLRQLADSIPGATLHEDYVGDEQFDLWIVACDAVVLPYRDIWSSGVLERAKLYGRHAIVSDVGGLRDQADQSTRVVRDDDELRATMAELAGVHASRGAHLRLGGEVQALSQAGAMAIVAQRASALRQRYELGTSRLPRWRQDGANGLPPPVVLPTPPAGHAPRVLVQRAVDRLTRWELMPLVGRVNEIRDYLAWQERMRDGPRPR